MDDDNNDNEDDEDDDDLTLDCNISHLSTIFQLKKSFFCCLKFLSECQISVKNLLNSNTSVPRSFSWMVLSCHNDHPQHR